MLNAVHLVVEVPTFKVLATLGAGTLVEVVCSDSCSACTGSASLARSIDGSDLASVIESNMWCKQDQDVAIFWAMTTECVPSGLTCERKSSKSS
jgi:hypothetical protein